jgi:hypothetical protein
MESNSRNRIIKCLFGIATLVVISGASQVGYADPIPYGLSGSYNATTYSFTADSTGPVVAFLVGGNTAAYSNELGLLVNGVDTGIYGLENHSAYGSSIDFGSVTAGDTLVFVLWNHTLEAELNQPMKAYSDPSMNDPYDLSGSTQHNHIYSAWYTSPGLFGAGIPTGMYVAFEDIPIPASYNDYNYNDESFVFTNVRGPNPPVPEPAALVLFGFGIVGSSLVMKRMRK